MKSFGGPGAIYWYTADAVALATAFTGGGWAVPMRGCCWCVC